MKNMIIDDRLLLFGSLFITTKEPKQKSRLVTATNKITGDVGGGGRVGGVWASTSLRSTNPRP